MKKGVVIATVSITFLALIFASLWYLGIFEKIYSPKTTATEKTNQNYKTVSISNQQTNQPVEALEVKNDSKVAVRPQEQMWDELHKMINTKIVADEIWGTIEITEDKVENLEKEVSASEYNDKETLMKMLQNWKNKNFSNAVDEHNYLWRKLGGTVGKATGLK